ncbi:MAG: transposase [Pirellulaceae bacterium]
MCLTDSFLDFCNEWESGFSQERTVNRATSLALAGMLCPGRKWLTNLRCVQGGEQSDWSADYKLFSRAEWEAQGLFDPVIRESLRYFGDGPIRIAGDETRTRRGGRKVKRSRWTRDPMSPPFHVNFIKGIRWTQLSALLPLHCNHEVSARSIPVSFEPVDLPAKPGRKATDEQKAEYKRAKRRNNMCLKTIEQLRDLRTRYDRAGATGKHMLVALDGGFCNRVMFRANLDRTILIARCRKDAKLCFEYHDPDHPRKVYSDEKFTPEQIRTDKSISWGKTRVYFGGKYRSIRYKEVKQVLWQRGAKRRKLRLLVVAPTAYKLSPGMRRYYRQPAYLLVTDHETSPRDLLQCYFDRWQIEVNHRDEKQHIGITDAQVWNDSSVDRLPTFMVCCYSFLMLAALRAFGPHRTQAYIQPPKWQRKKRRRPSCIDLITKLREEAYNSPQIQKRVDFNIDMLHIFLRAA